MNPDPLAQAYLHFLQLSSAVTKLPEFEGFDANHKALFESVMLSWFEGKALTVRETIGQSALGSPATLHKRLQRLIGQNLVISKRFGKDRRTKFVLPTDKGLAYLDWLGQLQGSTAAPKEPLLNE
jgi:hypothetical protein